MTNVNEISYFFNFPVPRSNSSKHELKDVCRTRWVEQIEGMDVFEDLFRSLLTMKENNNIVHYNNDFISFHT